MATLRSDAAYIDNWLKVLKADKKAIFTAASQAAKATDFLGGLPTKRGRRPDGRLYLFWLYGSLAERDHG